MYALTGASGQLGRLTLRHLLTHVPAEQIIATTRHPEGLAEFAAQGVLVRQADFANPATLPPAFAGASRLLIISADLLGQRVEHHRAAIAAAVRAGVGQLLYTSDPRADPHALHPIPADHGYTEAALAASGVPWMALRNSYYAELLPWVLGTLLVKGHVLLPEGTCKHSWITREDCARAAAGALAGKLADRGPVEVSGPEALSFADLAQRLSRLAGHTIPARILPDDDIIAQVIATGVPEEAANVTVRFASWTAREVASTPTDTVERASGVKPSTVDAALRSLANAA